MVDITKMTSEKKIASILDNKEFGDAANLLI